MFKTAKQIVIIKSRDLKTFDLNAGAKSLSVTYVSEAKKRGFALMSKAQLYAVTSAGGKAVHAVGTAHTWTRDEAIKAGSKGGKKLKGSKWSRM